MQPSSNATRVRSFAFSSRRTNTHAAFSSSVRQSMFAHRRGERNNKTLLQSNFRILFTRFTALSLVPNSRRCCPIPERGEWKSSFSKCRTRNRYVSAQCTFFHSWNKVVRGREMVPLIGELFSSIRRQRRETDDRSCVPVRFFLYLSFFVSFFAYLFEGSSPKLSVKIRDHRCWRGWRVFDAERMEGKHWREKKKKMRSKPHECMRMCVIVGKSDWTRVHARKDHERET